MIFTRIVSYKVNPQNIEKYEKRKFTDEELVEYLNHLESREWGWIAEDIEAQIIISE